MYRYVVNVLKEDVTVWSTSCRRERLKEVILARIRIGHTKYTHIYLLNNIPQPFCEDCLIHMSIEHILTESPEYSVQRRRNFGDDGKIQSVIRHILRDDDLAVTAVFSFLTETRLLHLLKILIPYLFEPLLVLHQHICLSSGSETIHLFDLEPLLNDTIVVKVSLSQSQWLKCHCHNLPRCRYA